MKSEMKSILPWKISSKRRKLIKNVLLALEIIMYVALSFDVYSFIVNASYRFNDVYYEVSVLKKTQRAAFRIRTLLVDAVLIGVLRLLRVQINQV